MRHSATEATRGATIRTMLLRPTACALLLLAAVAQPAESPPADDRLAAYRGFREAFDAARYEEALTLAREVERLTDATVEPESLDRVAPLTNLATTHYRLRQYGEAIDLYSRAIALLEDHADRSDPRLIRPLHGLGAALHALERDEEAIAPLNRAVEIVRNRHGLYDERQLAPLRTLVAAYTAVGRYDDATREQQYALTTAESVYGREDVRMLGPLDDIARWQEGMGRYADARALHSRAVQLAEKSAGRGSPLMVPALRGIARTYRLGYLQGGDDEVAAAAAPIGVVDGPVLSRAQVTANPDGERALRMAIALLRAKEPPDLRLLGEVHVDLGDWYVLLGSADRGRETYRDAWRLLSAAGGDAVSLLSHPEPLVYRPPSNSLARRRGNVDDRVPRKVTARFTVRADGDVRDVTIVTEGIPESETRSFASSLRRARFRPRFEDGRAVETTGVEFEETLLLPLPSGSG